MGDHKCPYCDQRHKPRWLCDPAKRYLDAIVARGHSFDTPEVEFPEQVPINDTMGALGLTGPGDTVLRQFVVQAATVPVAGVPQAGLLLTGRGLDGKPLPRWLLLGNEDEMTRNLELFGNMAALALRHVEQQRRELGLI